MESYFTFGKSTVSVTRYLLDKVYKHNGVRYIDDDKLLNDLVLKTLTNEYNTNYDQFYDKWVKFELEGNVAQEDTLYYLDNYCRFYKNAFLVSENYQYAIETKSLIYGNSVSYNGTKFYLNFNGEKRLADIFKETTFTRVLVDIEKVSKIVGDFEYFEVIFDNGCKLCLNKGKCIVFL